MNWAKDALMSILPSSIRNEVIKYASTLLEVRVRMHQKVQYILRKQIAFGNHVASADDFQYIINTASRYSPWNATTIADGYITTAGGHRIGIAGEVVVKNGSMYSIRNPMSLCIRVAREYPGFADQIPINNGNYILLGPPGSGKTTLLRDLIRTYGNQNNGSICVIDERQEIFPICNQRYIFDTGISTDILSGCPKSQGVLTALRVMGPHRIAVDEITQEKDCIALEQAGWCGVSLLATAHASSISDFRDRAVYQSISQKQLFDYAIVLSKDKTYKIERI